jgi:vacuolar-type H+-ATPase subunit I/STV1
MLKSISELIEINDQALKANKVAQEGLQLAANTAGAEEEERIIARLARARQQAGVLEMIGAHLRAAAVQVVDMPGDKFSELQELAQAIDDEILRNAKINFTISLATDLLNKSGEVSSLLGLITPTLS